ncbi:MAG: APC family permease, partial [Rhodanobacteraceae bacterium]
SPSGTGATYTTTTARMLYGMERIGTLPKIFGRVHPRYGIPRPAMRLNLVVAFIFLFFFRARATPAEVISVATIISYLTGPVSVSVLRRTAPDLDRPLRIPLLRVVAGLAFVFATELLYWARWPRTGEIILLMVIALPVWFWYAVKRGGTDLVLQVRGALWLVFYLPAVAVLSWGGSTRFGGHGYLPYGWDLLVVAAVAVGFFAWGLACGWRTPEIDAIKLEAETHPDALMVPPDEATAERMTGR